MCNTVFICGSINKLLEIFFFEWHFMNIKKNSHTRFLYSKDIKTFSKMIDLTYYLLRAHTQKGKTITLK